MKGLLLMLVLVLGFTMGCGVPKAKYDELTKEKVALEAEYKSLIETKAELEARYDKLVSDKEALQVEYDRLVSEKDNLKAELEERYKAMIADLEKKLKTKAGVEVELEVPAP